MADGVAFSAEVVDRSLILKLNRLSPALRHAIGVHILDFAEGLRAWTISHYLSGDPLHQRSGNLIRSLNVAPLTETESEISTSVGTNIEYAPQHEFGLTVNVPQHSRLMTMAFGRPVTPREIEVRAHSATYPKRAFLLPSLEDRREAFTEEMNAAVAEAVEETNGAA